MSEQRITLAHGPDGRVVQATAVGFNPNDDSDRSVLEALNAMIDDCPNVIAFDGSIEVRHVFHEDGRAQAWDEGAAAATRDYGIGEAVNPYRLSEAS